MRHARRAALAALLALLALLALFALAAPALAGRAPDPRRQLTGATVFAAASLTEMFKAMAPRETFNFAGSDQLTFQIEQGAPADVFASANTRFPDKLYMAGLLRRPHVFATNRLVVIVPKANPARITSLQDLARDGVKLVIADRGVPVGDFARTALSTLGLAAALSNVVSNEDDVKAVVGKVALGEADAGICYATDIRPVKSLVTVFSIPPAAQPTIEYGIGVVTASKNRAAASRFVRYMLSPGGTRFLTAFGFGVPTR